MYLSVNHLCFYSYILGKEIKLVIKWVDVKVCERLLLNFFQVHLYLSPYIYLSIFIYLYLYTYIHLSISISNILNSH